MRYLLAVAVLVLFAASEAKADVFIARPADAKDGTDVGRYEMHAVGESLYVFDTVSGRAWLARQDPESQALSWEPTMFVETETTLPPDLLLEIDIPGVTTLDE